jgi:hypothetical protein
MPDSVVKKIKINGESRLIAATYDDAVDTPIKDKYITKSESYTKDEVDLELAKKANSADVYTKDEANSTFLKDADVYTKDEINSSFVGKTEVYTTTDSDDRYQQKNLSNSINVNEIPVTTVEEALSKLNEEIITTRADMNTKFVKTDEIENYVDEYIETIVDNGELEVKATVNKSIEFKTDSFISLSNPEEPYQIIKIWVVDATSIDDSDSVKIELDQTEAAVLTASYIRTGAVYEIYQKALICKNIDGTVFLRVSNNNNYWGTFSARILTQGEPSSKTVTFMVYKEG